MRSVIGGFFAMLATICAAATAQAQTKPVVTSLGPDYPKSEIFIGNSFFYFNNGMPSHVSLLEKAADPEHKQDYRAVMVTISGSGLDWHDVESYFRPAVLLDPLPRRPAFIEFARTSRHPGEAPLGLSDLLQRFSHRKFR